MVRIVAGTLKGRALGSKVLRLSGRGGRLRPTASKVREAIFNILGQRVQDAVFIDLYAGTGAVGMEAMSRGAAKVYFVEANRKTADEIDRLLEGCGCKAKAIVVRKKASSFIKDAASEGIKADIIFLDPPYHTTELDEALELLSDGILLNENSIVIAEHLTKKTMPFECGLLGLKKSYKYGDTTLSVYVPRR